MSSSRKETSELLRGLAEATAPFDPGLGSEGSVPSGGESGPEPVRRLFELLYDDLRTIAARQMAHERAGHTLQTTALVHEVYLRLVDESQIEARGRAFFLAAAARAMRHVLIDHARRRGAQKRGGNQHPVSLDVQLRDSNVRDPLEVLAVDDAMNELSKQHDRAARVAEMKIFGGGKTSDVALALGVSERTIDGDWAFARTWLKRELKRADADG